MRNKTRLLIIIFLIINLFGLTACQEASYFLGAPEEAAPETVLSSQISIPIEKYRTLNPILTKDEDAYYLHKLIYDGLFTLDQTLAPVEALASSYQYGPDGLTMTVSLQNNILWQDGSPLIADDVVFSIEAYKSAAYLGGSIYSASVSLIKSAKAIGSHSVLLTFQNANDVAVENLTFPILPSHRFAKPKDMVKESEGFMPVGTGMYRIDSIETGETITLTGNPTYRGEVPENTLIFKLMPGREEVVNLFPIGEINVSFLKNLDRNTLLNDTEVRVTSFPSNEVEVLGFNFRNETIKDIRVRQAIAYGIDRTALIETCYYNSGIPHNSLYYPGYLGVFLDTQESEQTLQQTKDALQKAGYSGLSLSLLVNGDDHARNLAAQMIKSSLAKVGITLSVVSLSVTDYQAALLAGDYDLFLGGVQIKDTYDLRPLLHTREQNLIGYSNLTLDTLLDRMQSAISLEEKKQTYTQIENILAEELPYYCLLYKTYGIATPTDFQGEVTPYFNNIYHGAEQWRMLYLKKENSVTTP